MELSDIEKVISILKKGWTQPHGLLAAILVSFVAEIALITATSPSPKADTLIILIPSLTIYIAWLWTRRLPKRKKGKVGFAVSLWCSDEEAACKVREDFVLSLQKLIKSGRTGSSFQFMEIPAYKAEKIVDPDDAQELRLKTKANFIIYGRVRRRRVDGSERYFLELDGLVAHKPISNDISQRIANEFSELLPRKVILAQENDLLSFQFASEWADVVAKYVIGISAAVSGDLHYAEKLFSDSLTRVQQISGDFPVFTKLKERIPQRLAEIFQARAQHAYDMWKETHDEAHIDNLGELLNQYGVEVETRITPMMLTLSSIYHFLSDRNIDGSIDCLKQIPTESRDAVWHFNQAFLSAYQGDLRQAIRSYRKGMDFPITTDLITQVEDFLCLIVGQEPDKVQLHYCLGFFNWKIKCDYLQAANDFRKFLSSETTAKFQKELKLSTQWLNEIETEAGKIVS